jgi:hypothetical protein
MTTKKSLYPIENFHNRENWLTLIGKLFTFRERLGRPSCRVRSHSGLIKKRRGEKPNRGGITK